MKDLLVGYSEESKLDGPEILLVERYADRLAGHWGDNLVRLCDGARELGMPATVVAVAGIHDEIRPRIELAGASIVCAPDPHDRLGRGALALDQWMRRAHSALVRLLPRGKLASEWLYVARCAGEVASLRAAVRAPSAPGRVKVVVILSASETLNSTAAALSSVAHVRVVHDHNGSEGLLLRVAEKLAHRWVDRLSVVATTPAVEAALLSRCPKLTTVVQPYAVADPTMRISADERTAARNDLGISQTEIVASLVGGWWPYKDIGVVSEAFTKLTHPLSLVVAGRPTDPARLEDAVRARGGRLIDRSGALTERELRGIYAASDVTIVSRVAGNRMESGLILDAARYGVPLVVSDHDPRLSQMLAPEPWAVLFPPGDSRALAHVLDGMTSERLPRPDSDAPRRIGMLTAREVIAGFTQLQCKMDVR